MLKHSVDADEGLAPLSGGNAQETDGANLQTVVALRDVFGPLRTFPVSLLAAVQLPQTGHPCIAQNLRGFIDGVQKFRTFARVLRTQGYLVLSARPTVTSLETVSHVSASLAVRVSQGL